MFNILVFVFPLFFFVNLFGIGCVKTISFSCTISLFCLFQHFLNTSSLIHFSLYLFHHRTFFLLSMQHWNLEKTLNILL
ncbi:uncharacterized protein VTP21DRAFT_8426 [Calcarisporiella thermophila]|uniref:uncharacterized protein n=1 Tax=Calcarisporiella thermophila TaxID=911321 RepID=UPI003742DAB5